MEEAFIKDRKYKKILWNSVHVPRQMEARKLFSSLERGFKIIRKAVKRGGVIIDSLREDCKYFCIFMTDIKKLAVCPIVESKNLFYIPTIYPAEEWHKRIYKEIIRKRKTKEVKYLLLSLLFFSLCLFLLTVYLLF